MRDILFRGKRTDTGEWVYGSLVYWPGDDEIGTIVVVESKDEAGFIFGEHIEVYLNTVGQYTGLVDKNGTKIFEGDILDLPRWYVAYSGDLHEGLGMNAGWYHVRDNFESWGELECVEWHEILGNIHDNPELLKVH